MYLDVLRYQEDCNQEYLHQRVKSIGQSLIKRAAKVTVKMTNPSIGRAEYRM